MGDRAPSSRPHYLEMKRAALQLRETSQTGILKGYASLFNLMDDSGDIVMRGAFSTTLRKRGAAGVKMLWQHSAVEPVGVWITLVEDDVGLRVEGRLDLSVARAREALSLIRNGAVDGLSIGFRTIRAQKDKESGVRRLIEVDLWEVSIVTFPMLAQARISAAKCLAAKSLAAKSLAGGCGSSAVQPAISAAPSDQAAARMKNGLSRLKETFER